VFGFGCREQRDRRYPAPPAIQSQTNGGLRTSPKRTPFCTGRGPGLQLAKPACLRVPGRVPEQTRRCAHVPGEESRWETEQDGLDTARALGGAQPQAWMGYVVKWVTKLQRTSVRLQGYQVSRTHLDKALGIRNQPA